MLWGGSLTKRGFHDVAPDRDYSRRLAARCTPSERILRLTRLVPVSKGFLFPQLADFVAKVENRRAIIFPPKDDVTGDRQSLYSQSRYRGRQ